MPVISRTVIFTTSLLALIATAFAADMTGAELKAFTLGKTAYIETTAESVDW